MHWHMKIKKIVKNFMLPTTCITIISIDQHPLWPLFVLMMESILCIAALQVLLRLIGIVYECIVGDMPSSDKQVALSAKKQRVAKERRKHNKYVSRNFSGSKR